jgi:hypothetical protein
MADQIIIDRARHLLAYDASTGAVTWRVARGNKAAGTAAGNINADGYMAVGIDGKSYLLHRVVWAMEHGQFPSVIDHINGDRLDNRLSNLRDVDVQANNDNKHVASRRSVSGLIGASWDKKNKNWRSEAIIDGARVNLGRFPTAQQAHRAYLCAKGKASW